MSCMKSRASKEIEALNSSARPCVFSLNLPDQSFCFFMGKPFLTKPLDNGRVQERHHYLVVACEAYAFAAVLRGPFHDIGNGPVVLYEVMFTAVKPYALKPRFRA